ncbi:MAG: 16S rRNA (cytosine(1402)-N(4))-methyltransferase RsmH [Phycisphaerales bacterium]|nr:16S rRNA (cytosine(1402)-N(4))-methyltransferase RsmH [Phycisphaerales bacterium]
MASTAFQHEPVLLTAVLQHIDPQPGDVILDGTVGLGGHATALLPRIQPGGRYIGLDLDPLMLAQARERLVEWLDRGLSLHHANYADFPTVLAECGLSEVRHMLLDLGANSAQFEDAGRGFSFDRDGPLDMRFDPGGDVRALDLVNRLSEAELADLFWRNGQESASRRIAKRICQVRHSGRITTTLALAGAVASAGAGEGKTHPATRVFQALRIAVNRELENVERCLSAVTEHLRPGGRLVVISFHSLEDALVKTFLRAARQAGTFEELTKRPVIADTAERRANPRSRSAKMRAAARMDAPRA